MTRCSSASNAVVVAEEPRHADQQILVERVQLARVAAQLLDVRVDVERAVQRQAPLDAARDRGRLVVREVDRRTRRAAAAGSRRRRVRRPARPRACRPPATGRPSARDRRGDLLGRQHLIDDAGARSRCSGMPLNCAVSGLSQKTTPPARLTSWMPREPSLPLPDSTTATARSPASCASERKKMIDRQRQPVPRIPVAQQQPPLADDHLLHRRQQVDGVRLDQHLVLGLADRHRRPPRQQLVHQALEVRRQVLEDDERHPGVGREVREQPFERLEPAGRCADADDVKLRRADVRRAGGSRVAV